MDTRRDFISRLTLAGAALAQSDTGFSQTGTAATAPPPPIPEREYWVNTLIRVAQPVLENLARNQLKMRMPVEGPAADQRRSVTHLEAIGRTLAGIAPWLNCSTNGKEEEHRRRIAGFALAGLSNAVDPDGPDFINFTAGGQNLVDSAFLALGLARCRREVWDKLPEAVRGRITAALQSTRKFKPPQNNWLLFSATVEAFLGSVGADWKEEVVETAFTAHETWYKGDGAYGDGPQFHWDYYNSFVIHPLLIEVLDQVAPLTKRWEQMREQALARARRYAAVQERLIAPDGSFPPLGRSLAYRCGAFHHLALMALRKDLPAGISPAQVREALGAVIRRTLEPSGTFDADGWLQIGLAGHQPSLAEKYISTGSLYLCTVAFLPLGLAPTDDFWSSPPQPWTSKKAWSGTDIPADHAI